MESIIEENKTCQHCKSQGSAYSRCSNCKKVYYCTSHCQKKDWQQSHSELCISWDPQLINTQCLEEWPEIDSSDESYLTKSKCELWKCQNPKAHVISKESSNIIRQLISGMRDAGDHRSWGNDKEDENTPFIIIFENPTIFGPVISLGFYSDTLNEWDYHGRILFREDRWYVASTQKENEPEYSFLFIRERKIYSIFDKKWENEKERLDMIYEHCSDKKFVSLFDAYHEKAAYVNQMIRMFERIRPKFEDKRKPPEIVSGYLTDIMPLGLRSNSGFNFQTHLRFRM